MLLADYTNHMAILETTLHPGESVIMTIRRHPLILVGKLIPFLILDYLPYLLPKVGILLDQVGTTNVIGWTELFAFSNPWVSFTVGVYWLFVWMGAFGVFVNHYLDQWILTSERIIDINQRDFWSRDVSSMLLSRVQNVETNISGFFHTLFGFGTVSVETGGAEVNRVRMTGLEHPREIRDRILQEVARIQSEATHSAL